MELCKGWRVVNSLLRKTPKERCECLHCAKSSGGPQADRELRDVALRTLLRCQQQVFAAATIHEIGVVHRSMALFAVIGSLSEHEIGDCCVKVELRGELVGPNA